MVGDFRVGDTLAVLKLARGICLKLGPEDQRSAILHRELKADIRYLGLQLDQLQRIVDGAPTSLQPQDRSIVRGDAIVGSFLETLQECEEFLQRHASHAQATHGLNSIAQTTIWHITDAGQRCEQLRARVQFHCVKIGFLLEPLQFSLLNRIAQDVEILVRDSIMREHGSRGGLPGVPAALAVRYRKMALEPEYRPFESREEYPIKELFDALFLHHTRYEHNPVRSVGMSSTHVNEFLKTRWILQQIQQHPHFHGLDSISRVMIRRVEHTLENIFHTRQDDEWIDTHVSLIRSMDDGQFRIWFQANIPVAPPSMRETAFNEVKILSIELADGPQGGRNQLTIFRQEDSQFRLLETIATEPDKIHFVGTDHWIAIPWYAAPDHPSSALSFQLKPTRPNPGLTLDLKERQKILEIQQAFTNYRVRHDGLKVKWSVLRDRKLRSPRPYGDSDMWSGVQVWEYEPLQSIEHSKSSTTKTVSSTTKRESLATEINGKLSQENGTIRDVPQKPEYTTLEIMSYDAVTPPPALIIYTKDDGKPTYIFVPLDGSLIMDRTVCNCKDIASDCTVLVFNHHASKKRTFEITVKQAEAKDDWTDWNIFLFAEPKSNLSRTLNTWNNVLNISLTFETADERRRFQIDVAPVMQRYKERISRRTGR